MFFCTNSKRGTINGGRSGGVMVKRYFFLVFCLLFLASSLSAQDPLEYKISVESMLVPLFVVDKAGNPVYDLTKEDLTLFVNGKLIEITHLFHYKFQYDKEIITKKITKGTKSPDIIKKPGRVIVIIIDGIYNSATGLRRSKKITLKLIQEGIEGDRFIIIKTTPGGGLMRIAGLDGRRSDLIKKVNKIPTYTTIWRRDLFSTYDLINIEGGRGWRGIDGGGGFTEKWEYKNMVKRYSQMLSQLKYELKTIIKPKIVFLISEGIADGAMYQKTRFSPLLFNYLKDIVKAVNHGGSVLYTINPQDIRKSIDRGASGEISLGYLARESGGKYFAGSDIEKIVKRIKKTTAAYYELSFSFKPKFNEKLDLVIKCNREGIRVHTLVQFEPNKPFIKMELVQKKLFAFNVVTEGSWSRMVGNVTKVKARDIKKEKIKDKINVTFNVEIPDLFRKDKIEAFFIRFEAVSQALDVQVNTIDLRGKTQERFTVKGQSKENLYAVLIEPVSTQCIFVKLN